MGDLSKHFSRAELGCRCGCGKCVISKRLLDLLEAIREAVGRPIRINSGYRCPAHNAAVGGVTASYHCQGLAADIRAEGIGADALWKAVRALWAKGFLPDLGGLGRYTGRIHVDVAKAADGHLREWDYRGRG
jgi:uncharacterized protein YcbK (DUF882 family)